MAKQRREQAKEHLDAQTLGAVREGLNIAENGKRWTMEEAFEFARKRRKEWATKPSDQRTA